MAKTTKFQEGRSGNPETQFKAGNPFRWPPGQSGNPVGVARSRVQFEEAFYSALLQRGSAEQVASLLWDSALKGEPWAIQLLLQRLAPESKQIKLTHGVEDANAIDYTKLTDSEIEQLERLLSRATGSDPELESREGEAKLQGVCDAGLAGPGTTHPIRGRDSH
jgi:hypothetical protein